MATASESLTRLGKPSITLETKVNSKHRKKFQKMGNAFIRTFNFILHKSLNDFLK